jgi:peptidoglycan/LPS O-acetylase OafA/YrhL
VADRLPSLDGLRAVAITLVIAAHAVQRGAAWIPPRPATYIAVLAYTGVKVFFVLSGFLITTLLLNELRQTGTLSLRTFYWRRTLRIFPAMYAFLIAIGAGYVIGVVHIGDDNPSRNFFLRRISFRLHSCVGMAAVPHMVTVCGGTVLSLMADRPLAFADCAKLESSQRSLS